MQTYKEIGGRRCGETAFNVGVSVTRASEVAKRWVTRESSRRHNKNDSKRMAKCKAFLSRYERECGKVFNGGAVNNVFLGLNQAENLRRCPRHFAQKPLLKEKYVIGTPNSFARHQYIVAPA